jgi:hypothetical protein
MAESGKFHVPFSPSPGNNPAVSVEQESGSAEVCGCCGQETVSPRWESNPSRPARRSSLASTSNIKILERFQTKALPIIVDAPWYVPNNPLGHPNAFVREEIRRYISQYCTRLTTHPNDQILTLMELPGNSRLRRYVPNDLPNRFLL